MSGEENEIYLFYKFSCKTYWLFFYVFVFLHFRTRILTKNATFFIDFNGKCNVFFKHFCVFWQGWGLFEASNENPCAKMQKNAKN